MKPDYHAFPEATRLGPPNDGGRRVLVARGEVRRGLVNELYELLHGEHVELSAEKIQKLDFAEIEKQNLNIHEI